MEASTSHSAQTLERQALVFGLSAVLLWSTVATGFKLGLDVLAVEQLLLLGSVMSWGIFALYCAATRRFRIERRDRPLVFGLGLVNPFAYYLVLPNGLYFLAKQSDIGPGGIVGLNWRLNFVIKFITLLPLAFGFVFQLPIAMRFLAGLGIIAPERFASARPVALPVIFLAAAILTPPDVITQLFLAVPMVLLYEIGIFLARRVYEPDEHPLDEDAVIL